MSRTEKVIAIVTGLVIALIIGLQAMTPKPTDWTETYYGHDRSPFACALVRDRLEDLFPKGVTTVNEPLYLTGKARTDAEEPAVHLLVNGNLELDSLDRMALLRMVENGDEAFIATTGPDEALMDTLGVHLTYGWDVMDSVLEKGPGIFLHGDTSVLRFTCAPLRAHIPYLYARGGMDDFFGKFRIDSTQVLAVNGRNHPVLLRMAWGKGHIYLCSVPQAFTNYYLLKDEARGFMERSLALLPDRPVLWDEFYKVGRMESTTPLRYILAQPALKAAYWAMVVLLLLYVIVYARRRQRAIPVLVPLKNTTKEFAETIGRLYFFKGDHADLARKMALYFKDDLRNKLYLRRATWDTETLQHMSERTGIPLAEWQQVFRLMDHYEQQPHVSEQQLLQLNNTLNSLRRRL